MLLLAVVLCIRESSAAAVLAAVAAAAVAPIRQVVYRTATAKLVTLDNRFRVNRQSIGSYSNRRSVVACDGYL